MRRLKLRKRAGFTLIEMMIALAILAFSLATLMGTQALTIQQLELADQMNVAAMLVRAKMLEIEEELRQNGFESGIANERGDFDDAGYEEYSWDCEVEPVEISDEAEDNFVANVQAELFGEGASGEGSLSGSAAVSQFLPMIIGQIPQFINQVGELTRKITLTVSWDSTMGAQTLTVTEYFVLFGEDAEVARMRAAQDAAGQLLENSPQGDEGEQP